MPRSPSNAVWVATPCSQELQTTVDYAQESIKRCLSGSTMHPGTTDHCGLCPGVHQRLLSDHRWLSWCQSNAIWVATLRQPGSTDHWWLCPGAWPKTLTRSSRPFLTISCRTSSLLDRKHLEGAPDYSCWISNLLERKCAGRAPNHSWLYATGYQTCLRKSVQEELQTIPDYMQQDIKPAWHKACRSSGPWPFLTIIIIIKDNG